MTNWYGVHIQPRTEKKVKYFFEEKGIENYLPLRKSLRQWSDRKKWVELPVISGYIFVNINVKNRSQVLQTDYVRGFVRFSGSDAIIPMEQINIMKYMLGQTGIEVKTDFNNYIKGEPVRVIAGPLTGIKGNLVSIKNRKSIIFLVEHININILVELPPFQIEKVNKYKSSKN
ncbi:MAG: UpxY family transcription antiterminator [Mariniphaga sp.]|nr:UpxY family transcription antiterminator [Mariniphaga sp.]